MVVGERIRAIRQSKGMSQGDIEKKTMLLRCYLSRVENGHTVPAVETLEKITKALGVSMAQLFQENGKEPEPLNLPKQPGMKLSGKDANVVSRLSRFVSRMDDRDKKLLVGVAQKLATR